MTGRQILIEVKCAELYKNLIDEVYDACGCDTMTTHAF
jgi:hypothetical protein